MKKLFLLSLILFFSFSTKKCNSTKDSETTYNILQQESKSEEYQKDKCNFTNYEDPNGKEISLNSLKDKVSFVFVWATWCPVCKAQIPNFNQLVEEYKKDSRIQFVSISVDQKKEDWKRDEKKLRGLKLWASENFHDQFLECIKEEKFNSVPYFMILDKNGDVYKKGDLEIPRPDGGKEELQKLIDEYLNSN